jgi:hypothetical protein
MLNPQITNFNHLAPAVVRTIREAFDDAVREAERKRPLSESLRAKLARRIVDLARHGECDAARLRAEALNALQL